ncbi:MAG: methyltransferase [Gracilimonas sp.]|uniref:class I SAM-dependent methyltransferase n=1 Tax=Gracilimonas sp. TaxID=1974203 RepID=UPI0019BB37A4|nr:methyltransferase [Gracilimonas sp.]MBD3617001.1 methyltransferase [Gracilimonas sp.]
MKSFEYKDIEYKFSRYPKTTNKSLRAWSAAEEHVLLKLEEERLNSKTIAVYNDRFGFLSCVLNKYEPLTAIERKSQQKSIEQNMVLNNLHWNSDRQFSPLSSLPEKVDIGIINIPKTLDLFRFYLNQLSESLTEDGIVICSFMTKYFSPQILSIAGDFFEDVEQSRARKKSRVLVLKRKKKKPPEVLLNSILYSFDEENREELKQYYGVFSGGNIDYATQFLIEHLDPKFEDKKVLDMASGNGVIARALQLKIPDAEIHLMDDSVLAIESSKLNLDSENTYHHWDDTLENLAKDSFDLVASNPPFHFGHETNIEVSIKLFQEVAEVLKPGGRFICVANQHLNYKTHLDKIFKTVEVIAQNEKFILYKSLK